MKKVTINGNTYLGTVKDSGKKTYLKNAMQLAGPDVKEGNIEEYIRRKNLGTLEETIELIGSGMQGSVSSLSKVQKLFLKRCEMTMQLAKTTAIPTTENEIFNSLLGK